MREADKLFLQYQRDAREAVRYLSDKYDGAVDEEFIWQVLIGHFECFDIPTEVVFKISGTQNIVNQIDSFVRSNGLPLLSLTLEEIVLEADIDGIKKADVKYGGQIWRIHKNDADPFPSKPHAHCYADNMKLHLGNGELFRNTQKLNERMKKKDLVAVRQMISQRLPSLKLPRLLV